MHTASGGRVRGALAGRLCLVIAAAISGIASPKLARAAEEPPAFSLAWGQHGTEDGEFQAPIGIAIEADDHVFVTDAKRGDVQEFTADGKFVTKFAAGAFAGGIAVDASGNVFVAAMMDHKISVHRRVADQPLFERVRQWGEKGTGDGQFDQPGGLAFGKDGSLFVCDQVNHRVQRFNTAGEFLSKWGEYGDKPGQFGSPQPPANRVGGPCFIAIDKQGDVYTTEPAVGRIQKFSPEGKFLAAWGNNEQRDGGFGGRPKMPGPIAITLTSDDRAWVSSTNHRVQLFSSDGQYLCGLGTLNVADEKPAEFHTPHGLAFDRHGNFYVVDTQNYRVQKFGKAAAKPADETGSK